MFPESRYIIIADHFGHFLHGIYLLLQQHGRLTQRHRVGWLKYNTFSDNSKSVSNGSPLALYYYTGEKYCSGNDQKDYNKNNSDFRTE